MDLHSNFQNPEISASILKSLKEKTKKISTPLRIMEFCGGHTHTLYRYGIPGLLPESIRLIHGPGCPVCVLPRSRVDSLLNFIKENNHIHLFCYGDLLRIPGSGGNSLLKFKSMGLNIHVIYSPLDSIRFAEKNPDKEVVFVGLGFETTTPPTALSIKFAQKRKLKNFSVYCNHVLTPAALSALLKGDQMEVDGFIGPGHVSTVIGTKPYEIFSEKYKKPIVISGFEPLDILQSINMLVDQLLEKRHDVENQYKRAVCRNGNPISIDVIEQIFKVRKGFEWRGLGNLADSALEIHENFADFDAEKKYIFKEFNSREHPGCLCGQILKGIKSPEDCSLFGTQCNPENPLGSCMVSSEGACAAVYNFLPGCENS